jgi:hypothetical protein
MFCENGCCSWSIQVGRSQDSRLWQTFPGLTENPKNLFFSGPAAWEFLQNGKISPYGNCRSHRKKPGFASKGSRSIFHYVFNFCQSFSFGLAGRGKNNQPK